MRILVVDDEADILRSMKVYLENSMGVQVETAGSGLAGLDVLRAGRVDLIVSDFMMPGMNGLQFLTAARDLCPEVPRILLTAFPAIALAEQAIAQAGISLLLAKPIQPAALEDVIREELALAG